MGILDRFRRHMPMPARGAHWGPPSARGMATMEEVWWVCAALVRESERLGRRENLSLSIFLEHAAPDVAQVEIYAVLGHLEAEGEIANVRRPSDGNLRFDLTERLFRVAGGGAARA